MSSSRVHVIVSLGRVPKCLPAVVLPAAAPMPIVIPFSCDQRVAALWRPVGVNIFGGGMAVRNFSSCLWPLSFFF